MPLWPLQDSLGTRRDRGLRSTQDGVDGIISFPERTIPRPATYPPSNAHRGENPSEHIISYHTKSYHIILDCAPQLEDWQKGTIRTWNRSSNFLQHHNHTVSACCRYHEGIKGGKANKVNHGVRTYATRSPGVSIYLPGNIQDAHSEDNLFSLNECTSQTFVDGLVTPCFLATRSGKFGEGHRACVQAIPPNKALRKVAQPERTTVTAVLARSHQRKWQSGSA